MVSTLSRLAMLVAFVLMLSQQPAFTSTELSRNKAGELLQEVLAEGLRKSCSLNPLLSQKPEFAPIKGEALCRMRVAVTGIRTTSPTEAIVERMVVTEANQSAIKQWLSAMNKLQDRLKNLSAERYCRWPTAAGGCWGWRYKFTDPSDGQVFSLGKGGSELEVGDIQQSSEWEQLETIQRYLSDLSAKGSLQTNDTVRSIFQLWDNGWRVMKLQ